MDVISSSKLEKYKEILEEINREFEKSKLLETQIQNVEDSITFSKLNQFRCEKKISYLSVKIFSSLAEIENLYDCDVTNYFSMCTGNNYNNYNFFLVEVFLAKSLLGKLFNSEWKLHICINYESFSVNKVVKISDKNSQLEVIPVIKSLQECVVSACLLKTTNGESNFLNLCSVNVDISYHFETYKEKVKNISVYNNFLNITKLYNNEKSINNFKTDATIQYQINCNFENNNFIETFIKNSYHRLNLEAFSLFVNDNKRVVDLQFAVDNQKVVLLYHKDTKFVKLKCSPDLLKLFKNYFLQYRLSDYEKFKNKLQAVYETKNNLQVLELDDLLLFYQQLRKLFI